MVSDDGVAWVCLIRDAGKYAVPDASASGEADIVAKNFSLIAVLIEYI